MVKKLNLILVGYIEIQIDSVVIQRERQIIFRVIDTGIGMNDEEKKRLSHLLTTGMTTGQQISSNTAGFGLGLFISNKIASILGK